MCYFGRPHAGIKRTGVTKLPQQACTQPPDRFRIRPWRYRNGRTSHATRSNRFLPKPVDDDKLLASLELAIEASIQNSQQARDIQDAKTRWSLLSPREQEVARLVAQGKLNKVIADELGISERTVQAHRANACQKLGVRHAVGLLQMIKRQNNDIGRFQ